ncbi:MAG: DUF3034 family protein [Pseudomonadaceae bacterium]|nr:DUF3034 family protein [Pseudomonadaceae bacterium]
MATDNLRQALLIIALVFTGLSAIADSKILATGGVSGIEGGSGGGVNPWALISGYGSSGEWGATAFSTHVRIDDFQLWSRGGALAYGDRVELSFARQTLKVRPLDTSIRQDIVGLKIRLIGELLYSRAPQISLGVQHKTLEDNAIARALGASDDSGTDYFLAASKLWFAAAAGRNLLTNISIRHSRANQNGLLGFGGPGDPSRWTAEMSAAVFINDHWLVGADYRQKSGQLSSVDEDDWSDIFVSYLPNKRLAFVAAWAELGDIAGLQDQSGFYLSAQVSL